MLKNHLKTETGPLAKRHSYLLFQKWLTDASRGGEPDSMNAASVLPLELFDPDDAKQHQLLTSLLSKQRDVIYFFLRRHGGLKLIAIRTSYVASHAIICLQCFQSVYTIGDTRFRRLEKNWVDPSYSESGLVFLEPLQRCSQRH
eukprot:SAG31_NODE_357_length_17115_cov_64.211801_6_plen_144_part_00